jgi:hypothetical protein
MTLGRAWLVVGLCAALVAAVPRASSAQWAIGASVGPTYSWMDGFAIEDQDPVWGYLAGAFFVYRFDRRWAVRVEGNVVNKGAANVLLESGVTMTSVSLTYLEVPMVLNLVMRLGRKVDLGVYGGATLGFTVTCFYNLGTAESSKCDRSPLSDVNTVVWSLPVGAEFRWNLPSVNSSLILDGRFMYGLGFPFETATARNHAVAVLARWTYYLLK